MKCRIGANVVMALLCCAFSAAAAAQNQPRAFRTRFPRTLVDKQPVLVCTRVAAPPKIDGEVDRDPVWQQCGRTEGGWAQLGSRSVSSRQTVVYACFDRRTLYLGFVCEEPELQRVRMDGPVQNADSVEAVIESLLICSFSGGNVLIDSAPGLGKTLIAKTLSHVMDLRSSRMKSATNPAAT